MKVYLSVDKNSDGIIQLSINDDNTGYRIAGPKYDGSGTNLLKHELNDRDEKELRIFLSKRNSSKKSGS